MIKQVTAFEVDGIKYDTRQEALKAQLKSDLSKVIEEGAGKGHKNPAAAIAANSEFVYKKMQSYRRSMAGIRAAKAKRS